MAEVFTPNENSAEGDMSPMRSETRIECDTCDICSHWYFQGEERCEDCPWLIVEAV